MPRSHAVLFVLACSTLGASHAAAQWPFTGQPRDSVEWIEDAEEALRSAGASGRPILAYVTSDHCGYCRKMERDTWADAGVAGRVRAGFTPLRLSAGANATVVESLGVRAFPTTIVLSPEGRGLGVAEGYLPPEKLTPMLDAFLSPSPTSVASSEVR